MIGVIFLLYSIRRARLFSYSVLRAAYIYCIYSRIRVFYLKVCVERFKPRKRVTSFIGSPRDFTHVTKWARAASKSAARVAQKGAKRARDWSQSEKGSEQTTAARKDPHLLRKLLPLLSLSLFLRISEHVLYLRRRNQEGTTIKGLIHKLFLDKYIATLVVLEKKLTRDILKKHYIY